MVVVFVGHHGDLFSYRSSRHKLCAFSHLSSADQITPLPSTGNYYSLREDHDKAIAAFKKALTLDPKSAAFLLHHAGRAFPRECTNACFQRVPSGQ